MHPPFGFALFYLRSVAPKEVKTSDIYWGAVPFVAIQVIMVSLIIMFPSVVSIETKTDMKEQIELKLDMPTANANENLPNVDFAVNSDQTQGTETKLEFSTDPSK
jgi:hypothetical protein